MASSDFKLAFKLRKAFIEDFNFVHLKPNNGNLLKYDIVFCSIYETSKINHPKVIELNPKNTIFQLKTGVLNALNQDSGNLECVIGIDPGNTSGVCIIMNRVLVDSTVFYSKVKLISWIKIKLKELNKSQAIVRIGNGGGKNNKEIVELLKKTLPSRIELQIVDEKNTSKKIISTLTSHEQSAIRIAKRRGFII
ncbi:MAG: hypothetical protein GPJ54_12900 [Candidatus Heimdallarchaeota archaeon]|nr:hypothetical protein [Candidatus Heimdallarchaeota archaeon]